MVYDAGSFVDRMERRKQQARRDPRSTHELISLALQETDEDRAWEYTEVLRDRATREVFEAACRLLVSRCPLERRLGANILNQFGFPERLYPDEALAVLTEALRRETDPDALASLCTALGFLGLPETVPLLVPLKAYPHFGVRFAVVNGLAGHEEPLAVETLIELSEDRDEAIRDWATFGLGTQNELDTPRSREALAARLSDPDGVTRAEAMVGLARRGDRRVVEPLLESLDPEGITRWFDPRDDLVLEAAGAIADPRLLPALLRLKQSGYRGGGPLDDAIRHCREGGEANR
jgi:HEAT repeat protein